MADILFWPPFPTRECLHDQLFRSVWHFLPFLTKFDRLIFPYAGEDYMLLDLDQVLNIPKVFLGKDYDPAIADYAPRFQGKVKLAQYTNALPPELTANLRGVVVWYAGSAELNAVPNDLAARTGCEICWADPQLVQQETLGLIKFALGLSLKDEIDRLLSNSVYLFFEHLKRWKGRPMSVFGNGPTLQQVVDKKFDPGPTLRAVCNSTIADAKAVAHLKPEIAFAGDPVQHGGASLYAGKFRADLVKALTDDPNLVFMTQLGFVPYFKAAAPPPLHTRIIGVGNNREPNFNIDLTEKFYSSATANIFTMLVLPVAFTISKQVDIYGCDGQEFAKATQPWSHANESDYMGKMAVTHRLHPAFWQRNFAEELTSYYGDMEDIVTAAEKKGIRVRNITPSYVPALARRFVPNV
ncbi:MAG: hypothetical protein JNM81_18070 [Rhodospirillaceae bacterium]|nr:hypothetical protein [Rhodospirillaceae bacterium]